MIRILSIGNKIAAGESSYKNNNFSITTAGEPLQAFNQIIKMPPDVIVIDMLDKNIDGAMVYNRVRKIQASRSIPVILIIKNADDGQFREYLSDELTKSIEKPFEMEDLFYKAMRALNLDMDSKKKKILVVDDDLMILETAKMFLDALYDVHTERSGEACLKYLETERPDLMILDIVMPKMDGIELLRNIRANDSLKRIPVLFQTGMCDNDTVKKCMELKPQGYTVKPIIKNDLLSAVASIFDKKQPVELFYIDSDENNRAMMKKNVKPPYKCTVMEGSIATISAIDFEKVKCIIINFDNAIVCVNLVRAKMAKIRIPIILVSRNTSNPSFQKELSEPDTYGLPLPLENAAFERKLKELRL